MLACIAAALLLALPAAAGGPVVFSSNETAAEAVLFGNGSASFTLAVPANAVITNGTLRATGFMPGSFNFSAALDAVLGPNGTATLAVPWNATVRSATLSVNGSIPERSVGYLTSGLSAYNGVVYGALAGEANLYPHYADGACAETLFTGGSGFSACSRFTSTPLPGAGVVRLFWQGYACVPGARAVDSTRLFVFEGGNRVLRGSLAACTTGAIDAATNASGTVEWEVCTTLLSANVGTATVQTDYGFAEYERPGVSVAIRSFGFAAGEHDAAAALGGALSECASFPCGVAVSRADSNFGNTSVSFAAEFAAVPALPVNASVALANETWLVGGELSSAERDFTAALQAASDACASEFCELNITVDSISYGGVRLESGMTFEVKPAPAPAPEPAAPPAPIASGGGGGGGGGSHGSGGGGVAAQKPVFKPITWFYADGTVVRRSYSYASEFVTVDDSVSRTVVVDAISVGADAEELFYRFAVPQGFLGRGFMVSADGVVTQLSPSEFLVDFSGVRAGGVLLVNTTISSEMLASDVERALNSSEKPVVFAGVREENVGGEAVAEPAVEPPAAAAPVVAEPLPERVVEKADATGLLVLSAGSFAVFAAFVIIAFIAMRLRRPRAGGVSL